ncbi:hypothetical protein [Neptunomonas sp.]|uniref:hypothetical protein n=1 Tax=Neptunomonas sp. TaxID=1971898 RepID=UPI0035693D0C
MQLDLFHLHVPKQRTEKQLYQQWLGAPELTSHAEKDASLLPVALPTYSGRY